MSPKTLIAERQLVTVTVSIGNRRIQAEKLGFRLPFARKPVDLDDMTLAEEYEVYVAKTVALTSDAFDEFASHLMSPRNWLAGEGGYVCAGRLCVRVEAPDRPTLFVDPSGGDYSRYVARLG
jgi:hypothetical protein